MAREKLDLAKTAQMIKEAGSFELDGKIYTEEDLYKDPSLLVRAHNALQGSSENGKRERKPITPRKCWVGLISPDGEVISQGETLYNQRVERDQLVESLSGLSALAPGSRVLLAVEDTDKREVTIENFSLEDLRALFQG